MSNEQAWTVDREGWAPGPWDSEPEDRVDFRAHGLPCFALRNKLGAWCGYAGVAEGHPLYGQAGEELSVHGGVTYAGPCHEHICHKPEPGESDDVWWFGFDCCHMEDLVPGLERGMRDAIRWRCKALTYRDAGFARAEATRLAKQLAETRA